MSRDFTGVKVLGEAKRRSRGAMARWQEGHRNGIDIRWERSRPGSMLIEIEDEVFGPLAISGEEIRLDMALGMFMSGRVTLGRAADIAGVAQTEFLSHLGERGIPLHYQLDDVELDLRTLDSLRRR